MTSPGGLRSSDTRLTARATRDADGRVKLHADIAHPINSACREIIQSAVIKAFMEEKERAKLPGYVCTYDDFDSDYDTGLTQVLGELSAPPRGYRTHGSHGTPRGTHSTSTGQTAGQEKSGENFGAGIM